MRLSAGTRVICISCSIVVHGAIVSALSRVSAMAPHACVSNPPNHIPLAREYEPSTLDMRTATLFEVSIAESIGDDSNSGVRTNGAGSKRVARDRRSDVRASQVRQSCAHCDETSQLSDASTRAKLNNSGDNGVSDAGAKDADNTLDNGGDVANDYVGDALGEARPGEFDGTGLMSDGASTTQPVRSIDSNGADIARVASPMYGIHGSIPWPSSLAHGVVAMHLVVDANGRVERADVISGTGSVEVDEALAEASRSADFVPCLLSTGQPSRCKIALNLEYTVTRSSGRIASSRLCALPAVLVGI